jgi:hypothetical protein
MAFSLEKTEYLDYGSSRSVARGRKFDRDMDYKLAVSKLISKERPLFYPFTRLGKKLLYDD